MKIVIKGKLPGLNKYTNSNRGSKFGGSKLKKEWTDIVAFHFLGKKRKEPFFLVVKWYEANKRRDPDNIVFAKKFILDGMQKAGAIENDGWGQILGFSDTWEVDKKNPRVEITLV